MLVNLAAQKIKSLIIHYRFQNRHPDYSILVSFFPNVPDHNRSLLLRILHDEVQVLDMEGDIFYEVPVESYLFVKCGLFWLVLRLEYEDDLQEVIEWNKIDKSLFGRYYTKHTRS